jgi:hypothetical protein
MEDGMNHERTARSVLECGGPPPLFQPHNSGRTNRKERKECKAGTGSFVFSPARQSAVSARWRLRSSACVLLRRDKLRLTTPFGENPCSSVFIRG